MLGPAQNFTASLAELGDLAGRPPLGLKKPKAPKACRRPLPKMRAKRKAYLASQARQEGLVHMGRVAQLPCLVCGAWPVEVHHFPDPRSDFRVGPLCPKHHRREYGEGSYHYSPKAFYVKHGTAEGLLARVAAMLNEKTPGD